jgi:hypothetical protein
VYFIDHEGGWKYFVRRQVLVEELKLLKPEET